MSADVLPEFMHHDAAEGPWVEEVAALGDAVWGTGAAFEEHAYPGSGHQFADPDLPEYARASSEEMWRRVLASPILGTLVPDALERPG